VAGRRSTVGDQATTAARRPATKQPTAADGHMTAGDRATDGRGTGMATADDDLIWLPLPEAAARLGKSTGAVRSMVRRDKLVTRKGNDGGVLVGVSPTVGDGHATAGDQATNGQATVELRSTSYGLR
jgi:hypothetical protein